ncbi:hypothetical protein JCM10207_002777 [Rhodosporidiobolus poonsookiae]
MAANPHARLRPFPAAFPTLENPSDVLVSTDIPARAAPRTFSLSRASTSSTPPPIIAASPFIPPSLVPHLMRNKRRAAITTKYLPRTATTNMEGALHSFVVALARVTQCADYAWEGGHSAVPLGTTADGKNRLGRPLVLSTNLHNDFENDEVAEVFFSVGSDVLEGENLLHDSDFRIPTVEEKDNDAARAAYDLSLRQHAIFHLTASRTLPSLQNLPHTPWSTHETISLLKAHLSSRVASSSTPSSLLKNRFLRLPSPSHAILSLELLLNTHLHALVNELSALEALCPSGYAYTFDPPAIFARRLPAELSTLLMLCALKEIVLAASTGPPSSASSPSPFSPLAPVALPAMRLFALNAFTPSLSSLLPLLPLVLPSHVLALSRADLFPAPSLTLATPAQIPALKGATLVVHNNSDAFGQNIESEDAGGSVDGVVGWWGDAARALRREREDLLRWVA